MTKSKLPIIPVFHFKGLFFSKYLMCISEGDKIVKYTYVPSLLGNQRQKK